MAAPIDHQTEAINRLLTQYRSSTKIKAIIDAFMEQVQEIEDSLQTFPTARALATATGEQLDRVGVILNLGRGNVDDATYRILLYAKIAEYYSEGQVEDIITIFKTLMGTDAVELHEAWPVGFSLTALNPDPIGELTVIFEAIDSAKAAGVGVGYFAATTNPAFAFLDNAIGDTSGFANIYPGEAANTTQKQRIYFDPYPPDAGNWILEWAGNAGSPTLTNASVAADVQTHLRNITVLGSVTVTGSFASGYFEVDMVGVSGDSPELIAFNSNTLTQSGNPVDGVVVESQKICSGTLDTGGVFSSIYGTEILFGPLNLNPTAAFATHRLDDCQSSHIMQVSRAVAADTVDIYDFNRNTMEYKLTESGAWVGGTGETFAVIKLYDQSGNGNHLKQEATPGARPGLILNDHNGYPSLVYNGGTGAKIMRTDQAVNSMCSVSQKTFYACTRPASAQTFFFPGEMPAILAEENSLVSLGTGQMIVGGSVDRLWAHHYSTTDEWAKAVYNLAQWANFALVHGSGKLAAYIDAVNEDEITVSGDTSSMTGRLLTGTASVGAYYYDGKVSHLYVFDYALQGEDHELLSEYTKYN